MIPGVFLQAFQDNGFLPCISQDRRIFIVSIIQTAQFDFTPSFPSNNVEYYIITDY